MVKSAAVNAMMRFGVVEAPVIPVVLVMRISLV